MKRPWRKRRPMTTRRLRKQRAHPGTIGATQTIWYDSRRGDRRIRWSTSASQVWKAAPANDGFPILWSRL